MNKKIVLVALALAVVLVFVGCTLQKAEAGGVTSQSLLGSAKSSTWVCEGCGQITFYNDGTLDCIILGTEYKNAGTWSAGGDTLTLSSDNPSLQLFVGTWSVKLSNTTIDLLNDGNVLLTFVKKA